MGEWLRFYVPVALVWAVVLAQLVRFRRPTGANAMTWVVLCAIAVLLTVQAPYGYRMAGALTGVPNIGRLIDHAGMLVAGWGAHNMLLRVNYPGATRKSLRYGLWVAAAFAVMCACFAFTDAPVDDVRFAARYATTPGVLEYWLAYLAGLLPPVVQTTRLAVRYAAMTTDPALRVGLRMIAAGTVCMVVYHVHKAVFFAAHRFGLVYPKALSTPLDRYPVFGAAVLVLIGVALPAWRNVARAVDWVRNYRTYQRLRPLWLDLCRTSPHIVLVPPRPRWVELFDVRDLNLRVYRRVVEVRDGRLALRPHLDPEVIATAEAEATRAGLVGREFDAFVEAITLTSALRAAEAGAPSPAAHSPVPTPGGRDLDSDIAFLTDVAIAYRHVRRKPPPRPVERGVW
ncbi:MAB_1171c family putative transporter [Saccharothrix australiensis]|uniref:DUF6545 domain-containing protein n=1 Tax=Saccharothrix australiensis TaxID=2072 RepID=A0A495VZW0_9PSEU|nr:MAB_1171c family putative transporter [Saccharothrix australiensis]RKT54684.1 hypothetical protein C8E97_3332 [Saccharothrix australiensis]